MGKTVSPPRSPRGSPLARRHPSPSTERYPVIYSSTQRLPERSNIPSTTVSSPSVQGSLYSNTSSPVSPAYPPIYHDRALPSSAAAAAAAAMAPSTAMARNNAMAFDMAPASTPTGRISKAKKGKRVHACDFPGCGKVFTRAEHKRRHELNHNPEATFQCTHPSCNKSFHRVDLLQRHQERHDLEAAGASPQHRRHPSQTSAFSEPPTSMPQTNMTSPRMNESAPRSSAGGMSIGSLVHPPTSNYAADMSNPFGISGVPYMPWTTAGEDQLYYTSDSSPMPDRYSHRQSISSASSVAAFDLGSGSPMATASMPTAWIPGSAPPNPLSSGMFGEEYASSPAANPMPIPLSDLDGYEWSVIRRELSTVPGLLSSPGRANVRDTIRWHCLELYWQCFHPTFPIVHRPTFLPTKPSPLLACAMVAIGSYYDEEEDSRTYSLALLEIAMRLLRRRASNITSRSRIVDLQTVVLLEVLSTFCARQISVQMSTRFRALFASLNQAHHWLTTSPLAVLRTLKGLRTKADLTKAHKFFVEHETRSRILHACSVLDGQQALLFEQSPTVRRHNGLRINVNAANAVNTANNILLPCDDVLWDASPVEKWAELADRHEYRRIPTERSTSPKMTRDFSFFQQQVATMNPPQQSPTKANSSIKIRTPVPDAEGFSSTTLNYHITEMCRHTPIRTLLTVAGESWLLGRKLEKQIDYSHARSELRKWIDATATTKRSSADSLIAHWHALKILRGLASLKDHLTSGEGEVFGTTYLIQENWAVYLACLICWAHGYRKGYGELTSNGNGGHQQQHHHHHHADGGSLPPYNGHVNVSNHNFSTPTTPRNSFLADPAHAAGEAQTYLMFTDVESPTALRDLDQGTLARTAGLLETVRGQKIARCMMGGLMNDAEQVLFKLVEGKMHISF